MKIEEQVLSIEQMKHLQELGVDTSDASMAYYNIHYKGKYIGNVEYNFFDDRPYISVHCEHFYYMHEYIAYNYRNNIDIKLEWKGVEK